MMLISVPQKCWKEMDVLTVASCPRAHRTKAWARSWNMSSIHLTCYLAKFCALPADGTITQARDLPIVTFI